MRHNEIWSGYFAPPLATHGEAIAATILFLSVFISGGLLAWSQLDALLMAGQESFGALVGGVFLGMILGLAVLALAYQGGRRSGIVGDWQAGAAVFMGVAAALASMWVVAPRLRTDPARYASTPTKEFEGNACEVCGELRCDIVAPVWCVSLLIVTSRQFGPPRRLCLWHARWNAAAAVGVCATLGWWGIPWGPIWTGQALWDNLTQGGIVVDRATAIALDEQGGASLAIRSKGIAALGVLLLLLFAYTLLRAR